MKYLNLSDINILIHRIKCQYINTQLNKKDSLKALLYCSINYIDLMTIVNFYYHLKLIDDIIITQNLWGDIRQLTIDNKYIYKKYNINVNKYSLYCILNKLSYIHIYYQNNTCFYLYLQYFNRNNKYYKINITPNLNSNEIASIKAYVKNIFIKSEQKYYTNIIYRIINKAFANIILYNL